MAWGMNTDTWSWGVGGGGGGLVIIRIENKFTSHKQQSSAELSRKCNEVQQQY